MSLHSKLLIPPLAANLAWGAYLLLAWLPEYTAEPSAASAHLLPALLIWLTVASALGWAGTAYLHHRLHGMARHIQESGQLTSTPTGGDAMAVCVMQIDDLLLKLQESQAALTRAANLYRQCEENLRESEERYVIAVRGASDGAMEWDITSGTVLYSPRWESMLGLMDRHSNGNISGWYSRIHAEDYERTRSAVQQLLDGRTSLFENEHRLRHDNGEFLWVAARGVVVRSASGKAMKFIAAITDITEKKLAQQLLTEVEDGLEQASGEEFFRCLVRNMARALNTKYAFITECLNGPDGKPDRVRSIAFWADEGFIENIEYDLEGTPCQEVIAEGTTCFYPMGLAQRYPKEAGLESYVGIAVLGPSGQVVGHLACLDTAPMRSNLPIHSVQKLFAMRASAEILRMTLEKSQKMLQQVNHIVCDNVNELILIANPSGQLEFVNRRAASMCGIEQKDLPNHRLESMLVPTANSVHEFIEPLETLLASADSTGPHRYGLLDTRGKMREITGMITLIHNDRHNLEKVVVVAYPV